MSTQRHSRPVHLPASLPPVRCEQGLLARVQRQAAVRGVSVAEYGRAAWIAAVELDEGAAPTTERRILLPPDARSVILRVE